MLNIYKNLLDFDKDFEQIISNRLKENGKVQVIVVPWLLNGYGYCTIRGLLMYRGQSLRKDIINPRMVQAYPLRSHGTAGLYQQHRL